MKNEGRSEIHGKKIRLKKTFFSLLWILPLLYACSENIPEMVPETEQSDLLVAEELPGMHIAFVDYLKETDEYAVHLELRHDKSLNEWYKYGALFSGKIIYEEEFEWIRQELPEDLANKWLDTRFMEDMRIYDTNNRELGEARFLRFERIEGNLISYFAAIFKIDSGTKSGNYAIGGLKVSLPKLDLDRKPREELFNAARRATQELDEWGTTQIGIDGHYYSLYQATHSTEYKNTCRLSETFMNKSREVFRNDEGEIILQLQPLPLSFNGKPVLLLAKAYMNSDVFWSAVYVYDGKQYVYTRNWGKLGKSSVEVVNVSDPV